MAQGESPLVLKKDVTGPKFEHADRGESGRSERTKGSGRSEVNRGERRESKRSEKRRVTLLRKVWSGSTFQLERLMA